MYVVYTLSMHIVCMRTCRGWKCEYKYIYVYVYLICIYDIYANIYIYIRICIYDIYANIYIYIRICIYDIYIRICIYDMSFLCTCLYAFFFMYLSRVEMLAPLSESDTLDVESSETCSSFFFQNFFWNLTS